MIFVHVGVTMSRLRTINGVVEEYKARDPQTAITAFFIRQLVTTGQVPSIKSGNRYLIDLDILERFFERGAL